MERGRYLWASWWLALAGLSPLACEKWPPRENVKTVKVPSDSPAGGLDAATFVPSRPDSGVQDASAEGDGAVEPACGEGPPPDAEFSKSALLASVASCATLQYCRLEALAERFDAAARAYADDRSEDKLAAAKDAWFFLMQQVQIAELLQFGPAASGMEPGGRGLREQIYTWPGASRCRVEEQLVAEVYEGSGFADTPAGGRGLAAAEYLLFETGANNACPSTRPINRDGTWAALGAEELSARKAEYLRAVAADVLARARVLHEAWRADGGDFARALAVPDGAPYTDQQAALNAVGAALLVYMDKQVKDAKLGDPLGLLDGSETSMLALRESLYANVSAEHLKSNLVGLRLIAQGCAAEHAGLGFDDWLRAVNAGQLADDLIAAIDDADRELATLDVPLEQALVENRPKVVALHAALKRITDLLKAELTTALRLEPPMSVEGDND